MQVHIREATTTDTNKINSFMEQSIDRFNSYISFLPNESDFTAQTEEKYEKFLEMYDTLGNSIFLVAEINNQIIGILIGYGSKVQEIQHKTTVEIFIDKNWLGKGVEGELIAYVLEWAKKSGIVTRIELTVLAQNLSIIRLFEDYGFRIEAKRQQSIYQAGQYFDDVIMALVFQ